MSFVIEKDIPIPAHSGKYPFPIMKVGESFVADQKAYQSAIRYARCHAGVKFTARKEGDQYRIWRIS